MKKFSFKALLAVVSLAAVGAAANAEVIKPEVVTPVEMSNRDVNRVVCTTGNINDVYYSQEKGVTVTNDGRNAYVKFLIKNDGIDESHVTIRNELYIVCNGDVYTMMVTPKDIPGKTYRLSSGLTNAMFDNVELLGPMAEEERALYLTLAVLKDDMPESFREVKQRQYSKDWRNDLIQGAVVSQERTVEVDGMGLFLTEYYVKADRALYLKESDFLQRYFGENIFAITVEPLSLKAGQTARVFVVQKEVLQ